MSHPTRVRGLKYQKESKDILIICVAPYAGAWIEIHFEGTLDIFKASHPTRVRGLKSLKSSPNIPFSVVAPYAGAWIEIIASAGEMA